MEKNSKSATDVMQQIVFGAVVDSISALRDASGGMPNTLLREIGAINQNVTFADLPKSVQNSIRLSVQNSFNAFSKEGLSVAPREIQTRRKKAYPKKSTG